MKLYSVVYFFPFSSITKDIEYLYRLMSMVEGLIIFSIQKKIHLQQLSSFTNINTKRLIRQGKRKKQLNKHFGKFIKIII